MMIRKCMVKIFWGVELLDLCDKWFSVSNFIVFERKIDWRVILEIEIILFFVEWMLCLMDKRIFYMIIDLYIRVCMFDLL